MQLINSTVIRELSPIFFPAAYIRGPIPGGLHPGAYKWEACILGVYIRGVNIPGGINPGLIPGLISRGLISGGL